jgi:hypothetical protein
MKSAKIVGFESKVYSNLSLYEMETKAKPSRSNENLGGSVSQPMPESRAECIPRGHCSLPVTPTASTFTLWNLHPHGRSGQQFLIPRISSRSSRSSLEPAAAWAPTPATLTYISIQ